MALQMRDIGSAQAALTTRCSPFGMPRDHQVVQQPARIIGENA
jgi:hypothetical protein